MSSLKMIRVPSADAGPISAKGVSTLPSRYRCTTQVRPSWRISSAEFAERVDDGDPGAAESEPSLTLTKIASISPPFRPAQWAS